MGCKYTSILIRDVPWVEVSHFLEEHGRDAFVSPTLGNWVVVHDRETDTQDNDILKSLAGTISKEMGCYTISAQNYDDNFLWIDVFRHGRRIGSYLPLRALFMGAKPWQVSFLPLWPALLFAWVSRRLYAFPYVWLTLQVPSIVFVLKHFLLAKELGWPAQLVILGHDHLLEEGSLPEEYKKGYTRTRASNQAL